jgi:enoyl-CoA hydratase/carnithine racemase
MFETILFDSNNGVATVTLNRPDRLNAFNRKMGDEFKELWRRVREDENIRAVVLRAAEGRAFCTGVDVKEGFEVSPGVFDTEDPGEFLGPKQNRVWKPLICAVHGMAAGGAFYWLNEAEIIICSDDAQFFDPHVSFGMVCAVEPAGAMRRFPVPDVIRMTLMGNDERICAATALSLRMVTEVTTRQRLWGRADELARIIAAKPAIAIQGSVKAMWEAFDMPRSMAVSNAYKYTQIGNPQGKAQVDRSTAPKAKFSVR